MELQKGQKLKLTDLTAATQITVSVTAKMKTGAADITCFGVDAGGKLSDDRYFVFYNQTSAPEGVITLRPEGDGTAFDIDLARLPQTIQKLVVTAAADSGAMRDITEGKLTLKGGGSSADFAFSGSGFDQEKAVILCEIYRKDGIWRCAVVASGFNGGLSALLAHFGGEESAPAPSPAPAQPPTPSPIPTQTNAPSPIPTQTNAPSPIPTQTNAPGPIPAQSNPPAPGPAPTVNLSKISLKKMGDSHKIDLSKNSGEIHVNLNWNSGKKRLFGGSNIDLDLACMFRLKSGQKGVIQALGNSFGRADDVPFILLDQDDRTGASVGGENMFFKRPELIDFAVVFAYIYEGVPNWRGTDAAVLLQQKGSPDIEIRIDNPDSRNRFCVLASLSGQNGALEIKREEIYFSGHEAVDKHYNFGFRWVAGHK